MAKSRSLVWNAGIFRVNLGYFWQYCGSPPSCLMTCQAFEETTLLTYSETCNLAKFACKKKLTEIDIVPQTSRNRVFSQKFPSKTRLIWEVEQGGVCFSSKNLPVFTSAKRHWGLRKTFPRLCLSIKWKVKRCQKFGLCDAVLL